MNDQNKDIQTKGTTESKEGVPAAAPSFTWRKMLGKRWVFPAVYMAAAAIILTLMWVYQDNAADKAADQYQLDKTVTDSVSKPDGKAAPVNANVETMQLPVKDSKEVEVVMHYYEEKATSEVKQAAMVEYGDTFTPHLGIDSARQDNKEFDVLAALSGKVTAVENHALVGKLVEITHPNGLVTVYQSLGEVKVTKGAEVKKGDVIGKAGRNELEKDLHVHLHFEVRNGAEGATVNPEQFLNLMENVKSTSKTTTPGTAQTGTQTSSTQTSSAQTTTQTSTQAATQTNNQTTAPASGSTAKTTEKK